MLSKLWWDHFQLDSSEAWRYLVITLSSVQCVKHPASQRKFNFLLSVDKHNWKARNIHQLNEANIKRNIG